MQVVNNNALMKAVAAELETMTKGIRIPEGLHTFDEVITLRVSGSAMQLEDQLFTPTAEIPMLAVLARVLERTGWSGDHVAKYLTEAITEALNAGEPVGEYIEHTKEAMRKVREKITNKLPKKTRTGAFRKTVKIDVLTVESANKEAA